MLLSVVATLATFLFIASANSETPTNKSCKSCHQVQWKEWRASQHFSAGKNRVFLYEYNANPGDWCLRCHAPRGKTGNAVNTNWLRKKTAMRQGVDCITCHVRGEEFVSRSKGSGSPHNTKTDLEFGSPKMCAGCHQFNFPVLDKKGSLLHYTSQAMQNTYLEFKKSVAASRGLECISCHMPSGQGHRFPGAYDSKMVNSALGISLCRAQTELIVTVKNRSTAHNLPSGGVNRSIVLDIRDKSSKSSPQRYRLERLFDGPVGKRVKKKDTTLQPGHSHKWRIPYPLLSQTIPQKVVVERHFYFGTDPNRNYPTAKQLIGKSEHLYSDLPVCSR